MSGDFFLIDMGKRIAEQRKSLKMTQEMVAEAVGMSLQSISCIELGKKAIRPENLVKLCKALDTNPDFILTGRRERKETEELWSELASLPMEDYLLVKQIIQRLNRRV